MANSDSMPPKPPLSRKQQLSYYLAPLGTVSPVLHAESADLYHLLDGENEVVRLKNLDHLGTIRAAWEGAHHSRWEYVMSIFHLVERCASADTPAIHLKSAVQLTSGTRVSSGEELLKSWALLSNIGHLNGTFAVERALQFEVFRHTRTEFLNLLPPDGEVREWATNIIDNMRTYRFYQVLAVIKLEELIKGSGLEDSGADKWREVLRTHVIDSRDQSETIVQLRQIYRNLRRLAFIALDSHYTPTVVRLDLGRALSDPAALVRLALRANEADDDDLRGLEQYLYREIYLGGPVLEVVARHEREVRRTLEVLIRNSGLTKTIRFLGRSRAHQIDLTGMEEDFRTVVRLAAWVSPPFDRLILRRLNVYDEQLKAEEYATRHKADIRALWWTPASGDEWVLQVHAPPSSLRDGAVAWRYGYETASDLHRRLMSQWANLSPDLDALFHRALLERFARELVSASLRLVIGADIRWEFVRGPGLDAQISTRRALRAALGSPIPGSPSSRADENLATSLALRWRPDQYAVVALKPLEFFVDGETRKLAEVDGMFVETRYGKVVITLVEAKRMRSGAQTAASNDLSEKIEKLKIREGVTVGPIASTRRGRLGWAWIPIQIG